MARPMSDRKRMGLPHNGPSAAVRVSNRGNGLAVGVRILPWACAPLSLHPSPVSAALCCPTLKPTPWEISPGGSLFLLGDTDSLTDMSPLAAPPPPLPLCLRTVRLIELADVLLVLLLYLTRDSKMAFRRRLLRFLHSRAALLRAPLPRRACWSGQAPGEPSVNPWLKSSRRSCMRKNCSPFKT